MNGRIMKSAVVVLFLGSGIAFAASGKVTISAPADGAMFGAKDMVKLNYEAETGPDGDHLHLNVDGKRVDVIHQLKGSTEIGPLAPGKHQICLAVNTKGHVPTGAEGCVNISAK